MTEYKAGQWPIGAHVVYEGKSYRFPGEVTMRDETGVVVKAFGDAAGNYSGMKHIYADHVLKPYDFGDGTGVPPLVIFADENPVRKIREWVRLHGDSSTGQALKTLLAELDRRAIEKRAIAHYTEQTSLPDDWEEREAQRVVAAGPCLEPCTVCDGAGWIGWRNGNLCERCNGRGTILISPIDLL